MIRITVLGSGTSAGVPTIGCRCDVCTSPDPRDNRLRPSILVRFNGRGVLIDTTPDFRQQALRFGIDPDLTRTVYWPSSCMDLKQFRHAVTAGVITLMFRWALR